MAAETPRARYRPKGQGFLVFERGGVRTELPLDGDVLDLPPALDRRLATPPPRAQLVRVEGGHALIPLPGSPVRLNHRPIARRTVLHGGDALEVDHFVATYSAAREELPSPMTVVVWPPSGPAIEIRSHRARLSVGAGDADLQIDDDTLNDLHCTIRRHSNGVMQIIDERSVNGVYVDGRRVVDAGALRDGAEVLVGRTRLKAWTEAASQPHGAARTHDEPIARGAPPGHERPPDRAAQEPLRPYAGPLGPKAAGKRRTFDDDVPTRLEGVGERADVRGRRRSDDQDGYHRYDPAYEAPSRAATASAAPPRSAAPVPKSGVGSRAPTDAEGDGFGRKGGGGLTLVHEPGQPLRPRRPPPTD